MHCILPLMLCTILSYDRQAFGSWADCANRPLKPDSIPASDNPGWGEGRGTEKPGALSVLSVIKEVHGMQSGRKSTSSVQGLSTLALAVPLTRLSTISNQSVHHCCSKNLEQFAIRSDVIEVTPIIQTKLKTPLLRNTAPAAPSAPAPNTGPGYW